MKDYILKEKDLLRRLDDELKALNNFILGNSIEPTDEKNEGCLMDSISNNLVTIDSIIKNFNVLNSFIRGEKN